MKRFFAMAAVLSGGVAAVASVMKRRGVLFPALKTGAGAVGIICRPEAPAAVFAISKVFPLFFSSLLIHFFCSVSATNFVSFLHRSRKP